MLRFLSTVCIIVTVSGCAMSPLKAQITGDGKYWIVLEDMKFKDPDTQEIHVVPAGFVTDNAQRALGTLA